MLDKILSSSDLSQKIVIICGPTATGKSKLALELAEKIGGIIINADAMQIYREIPIITAQPTPEELEQTQHRLYSIIGCGDPFSVGMWLKLALLEIKFTKEKSLTPIVVGGNGLYIKSLIDGLATIPSISEETKLTVDKMVEALTPEQLHSELRKRDGQLANRLEINDIKRITRGLRVFEETGKPLSHWQQNYTHNQLKRSEFFLIYLKSERSKVYQNCNDRFVEMVKSGAIDEIRNLHNQKPNVIYPKAHGLYEILSFIKGEIPLEEAIKKTQQYTRNYIKRQLTWFNHQLEHDLTIS